jgi:hypothetical protein
MKNIPESGTVGHLLWMLRACAETFKEYAALHRAKMKKLTDFNSRTDNVIKIQRNELMVETIEQAIKDYEISATAETVCPECNAPCVQTTYPRGGDYGWGDASTRIRYVYIAPKPENSESVDLLTMDVIQLQATVEALETENKSLKQRLSDQHSDAAWERTGRSGQQGGA